MPEQRRQDDRDSHNPTRTHNTLPHTGTKRQHLGYIPAPRHTITVHLCQMRSVTPTLPLSPHYAIRQTKAWPMPCDIQQQRQPATTAPPKGSQPGTTAQVIHGLNRYMYQSCSEQRRVKRPQRRASWRTSVSEARQHAHSNVHTSHATQQVAAAHTRDSLRAKHLRALGKHGLRCTHNSARAPKASRSSRRRPRPRLGCAPALPPVLG